MQIPGPVADLPEDVRHIVQNRNPDYARKHAPEDDLALAVVNASDVAAPDDLAEPSATCWVKMSEIGIEGLRQAFLQERRRNLLAEWEDTKAEEFRALERAGKRVTRQLLGRVRVRVEFGGTASR